MAHAQYVERMKDSSVLETAARLSIEVDKRPGNRSPGSFPCPICGAEKRHGETGRFARGAVGIKPGDAGWSCYECPAEGDAMGLVCAVFFQKLKLPELSEGQKQTVREWVTGVAAHEIPKRKHYKPPPPAYPPKESIERVWSSCVPVTEDEEVSEWCREHFIDPELCAKHDWARALPRSFPHHWVHANRRFIAPLRNVDGEIVSLKARGLEEGSKSRPPAGFSTQKLCFFDPASDGTTRVIFVEGEKKFAQMSGKAPGTRVIGIMNGSVTDEYAKLVPATAEVWILTDHNDAGASYATAIYKTLHRHDPNKIRLRRGLAMTRDRRGVRVTLQNKE